MIEVKYGLNDGDIVNLESCLKGKIGKGYLCVGC